MSGESRRDVVMAMALLHGWIAYAATLAAGLLMVRIGSAKGRIESRQHVRWCGACHRRFTGSRCDCSRR